MQERVISSEKITAYKNILVTGAAGLVGGELTKQLLDKGYKVTAIYNKTPVHLSHSNLITRQCDILDTVALEEIMEEITHVYHCAAIVSFEPKEKSNLFKINVEGTENIVNACISADVKKLVYVSSVAALGKIHEGEIVTEQMNWNEETNNSVYGKSKYLGELEVWRGIGEGLSAAIVNPSIILGGSNWNTGSSALFKSAYNEFNYYTDGVTGFVDVRDVAAVMIMLMNSEISGQRFILNSENISYKELFFSIAKCFGKKSPQKKATPLLAGIVWRVQALKNKLTGNKNLLTKETARNAQAVVRYNNDKILKALPGFTFIPVAAAVENTCVTLKNKYHL